MKGFDFMTKNIEIKGYITNLGRYNEGLLIGEWVTFPIDKEEINKIMKHIGCYYVDNNGKEHNHEYEEYFFTDWECDFDCDLGEYESISHINELAEKLKEWDPETLAAACEMWGFKEVIENNSDDYSLYYGINDDYDLGYYYAIECGGVDFHGNETLEMYFDFDSYGRDIAINAYGGFTSYGFIECLR